jgi:adhesin/invasin
LDATSAPLANVTVSFTTPNLGGVFPGGASIATDVNGIAATTWKLGSQSGPQTAQAAVGGPAPAVFSATALSGPVSATLSTIVVTPSTITASNGANQSAITVTARDAGGNLVSGATVVVAVTGTGSLSQPGGPTGANGQASGGYSSTAAGAKTVSATVNGVALTQTATITVQAASPKTLAALTSTSFSVTFGGPVSPAPKVHVTDQFGNPVPSVSVGFAITAGASTLSNGSATTNASGDAQIGWQISAVSTDFTNAKVVNRIQASVGGATGSPVTFTGTVNVVHYGADIQSIWNGVCNSCHTGHNHPELNAPASASYSAITNPGLSGFYVVPGDSVTRSSSKNMLLFWPPNPSHGGCCIASNLITIIAAWIAQGAPQN